MAYTYILDGGTLLADEPMGWDKSKLKIARNDVLKGMYVRYVTTLIFVGDGYDYILNKANTDGICSVIDIEIRDTSNSEAFHFNGKIYIENIKLNLSECTAECVVEDDSLSVQIIKLAETKIECFGTTTSIGGEVITPVGQNISLHDFITANGSGQVHITQPLLQKKFFNFFDLIQYMLNYLTDNGITLQSDFLTTNYLMEKRSYELGGTVAVNDVITYTYVNCWGETVTDNITADYTDLTKLATHLTAVLRVPFDYTIVGSVCASTGIQVPSVYDSLATYQGDLINFASNRPSIISGLTTTIDTHYFAPYQIIFSSTGATTFTETVDQEFVYGGSDLWLSNGSIFNNSIGVLNLSLQDIFNQLYKWFNINVRFYKTGGVQYCRIEPAKYFYDQINNLSIDAFNELTQEYVTDIGISSLKYAQPDNYNIVHGLLSESGYAQKNCYSRSQDSNSDWKVGWQHISDSNYLDLDNNDIVVIQSDGINIGGDWVTPCDRNDWRCSIITYGVYHFGLNPGFCLTGMPTMHYHVAKNHGYFGTPELVFNGRTLTIDDVIQIQKIYSFKTALTCDQVNTLLDNPLTRISFSDNNGNGLSGWIKEAEYDITSGLLTVSIYSE
jgi:hypothetical protein